MIRQDRELCPVEPQGLVQLEILKTLREFKAILETTPPHTASTCHEAGTIDKVINMELTAMLMRSGFDGANGTMDAFMDMIHFVLVQVRRQADRDMALDKAIALFDKRTSKDIVHVHRITAEESEPRMTRVGVDNVLGENYQACMEDLAHIDAKPDSILLAIDSSPERCRSKFKNGLFTAVRVGGSAAWELGYKQSIVKDVTSDLFTGCIHRGKWQVDNDSAGWEPWIRDVQTCVARVHETVTNVEAIGADRDYFCGELFAIASAGMLAPSSSSYPSPRVFTPRQFGPDKATFIWDYLTVSKKDQVFVDYAPLDTDKLEQIKKRLKTKLEKRDDGRHNVPYACVALVDEYRKRTNRTLEQLRAKSRYVQERIDKNARRLEITQKAYMIYHKRNSKQKVSVPSLGRGLKRRRFIDRIDKQLYTSCRQLLQGKKILDGQKRSLISSVVFFAISLRPDEDPSEDPETFIALAKDYHARWGIENGIKMIKHVFRRHVHGRRPVKRQLATVLAMIVQNRWQVARKADIRARLLLNGSPVAFTDPKRPWIRRKFEEEMHDLLPAVRFLIEAWKQGLLSTIKEKLKEVF
jgi:hypothetical protein